MRDGIIRRSTKSDEEQEFNHAANKLTLQEDRMTSIEENGNDLASNSPAKSEKRNKKRKRSHSADIPNGKGKEGSVSSDKPSQAETVISEVEDDSVVMVATPNGLSSTPKEGASNKGTNGELKRNPFAMPKQNSKSLSAEKVPSPTAKEQSPATLSPSKKNVIEFNDSDESEEDSDYSPQPKRKQLSLLSLSPRHSSSPKGQLASPKKVNNREKLLNRRGELLAERRRLPIWSGIPSVPNVILIAARDPLLQMIEENQVTILLGETGCGKSTRKPLIV